MVFLSAQLLISHFIFKTDPFLESVLCFPGNVNQNPSCQAVSQTGKTEVNTSDMQSSVRDTGVGSKGLQAQQLIFFILLPPLSFRDTAEIHQ